MNQGRNLSESLRALWPWLPLWMLLALLAIFSHGPMPLYSTRTLAVAWEMWNGHHFIVPYLNGEPYSHKVPLVFWMIHAGWYAFGVNDIWPRILEVAFGAVQLMLAATLARRLAPGRPWVARATPWMLLALGYAFLFGLQIMYEVLLAVWVLAALLTLTPKPHRAAPRFVLFAVCIGLGLLTKGPVMLLHVLFPWLLGPLWNDWARDNRLRWYGGGVLAVVGGCAMLAAWVWPAIHVGGQAYANELLFKQTEGRVVDAFDHARPLWWYLPRIGALLFPFFLWPRMWLAVARLRRPLDQATRFALCWLLPVFIVFSLISGKQTYYLIPELAGAMLLLASAMARLREEHPRWASTPWLGPWPAALVAFAAGISMLFLPNLVASGRVQGHWWVDLATHSRFSAAIILLLGLLVLVRGRGELRRLALAGLVGAFVGNAVFTLTQWQNYNLVPTADLLSRVQKNGAPIANIGSQYAGQYQFLARLQKPVQQLQAGQLQDWAGQHPDGVVLTNPEKLSAADMRYAIMVQPFRSSWVVAWRAPALAALRAGHVPDEPEHPTQLVPEGYWRYGRVR